MKHLYLLLISCLFLGCNESKTKEENNIVENKVQALKPILLDKRALAGLDLKPVKNANDPDRRLFQKKLIGGDELSVYIVSSETATAQQDNYGMEEYIYLLNGRSRMNPKNGPEVIFEKGDHFIAPKGFTGEWETIGGKEFLIELSVIATKRSEKKDSDKSNLPYLIDKKVLAGFGIERTENGYFQNKVYAGRELTVNIFGEQPVNREITTPENEQIIHILSGGLTLTQADGKKANFLAGDFFMLPKGYVGTWSSEGHGLFRYMKITVIWPYTFIVSDMFAKLIFI